jgi:predicted pyridoxine 5'-phosphate oxidase superfamily flavin-nucleotide-binding protein
MPNVSPKEIFCLHGERELLIANIASPQSESNIRSNPNVCVSFVDVFVQKGFKLKGAAVVVEPVHPRFNELEAPLKEMTGGAFAIQSVICVHILTGESIVAPSYRFREGTTEESQAIAARQAYRWPR